MTSVIEHRGPDSEGRCSCDFAEVGFRRLSIIDVAGGRQPAKNEEGTVECFLNGEIYNYKELRRGLEARGHRFHSLSDTEVLPHLYEEYGTDLFGKLNGMFTVVVVDRASREVHIARDHFGIKQMYYARVAEGVVFASEVKAVLASGLVEPEVDRQRVLGYLTLFYCPGEHTLLRGVDKLMPGTVLTLRQTGAGVSLSHRRFYELPREQQVPGLSPADAATRVRELFTEAVASQLVADVPVGVSLSGGVDSSAIAYTAAVASRRSGVKPPTAVTISFPNAFPEELECSRELSRTLGLRHIELAPPTDDVLSLLPQLAWIADEPIADPALYSQWCVAKAARSEVSVLLGGAGGDELFGGYGWHKLARRYKVLMQLPRSLWGPAVHVLNGGDQEFTEALLSYPRNRAEFHCIAMSSLGRAGRSLIERAIPGSHDPHDRIKGLFEQYKHYDAPTQQMLCDLESYLPEQILPMTDRATMAASIEGRVPFLDVRLVEFAASLSGGMKLGAPESSKSLLKRALREGLPASIRERRKMGMPSPFGVAIGEQVNLARQVLLSADSFVRTILPEHWLNPMLRSRESANENYRVLYSLLIMEAWHRLFIVRREYSSPTVSCRDLFEVSREAVGA